MWEPLSAEERVALNYIALQRIAEEAERRMGILNLTNLGLMSLPPQLAELTHLEWLTLGSAVMFGTNSNRIVDLAPLSTLVRLRVLSFENQEVSNLQSLSSLLELESIHMELSLVRDLTPLATLGKLREIHCSGCT